MCNNSYFNINSFHTKNLKQRNKTSILITTTITVNKSNTNVTGKRIHTKFSDENYPFDLNDMFNVHSMIFRWKWSRKIAVTPKVLFSKNLTRYLWEVYFYMRNRMHLLCCSLYLEALVLIETKQCRPTGLLSLFFLCPSAHFLVSVQNGQAHKLKTDLSHNISNLDWRNMTDQSGSLQNHRRVVLSEIKICCVHVAWKCRSMKYKLQCKWKIHVFHDSLKANQSSDPYFVSQHVVFLFLLHIGSVLSVLIAVALVISTGC